MKTVANFSNLQEALVFQSALQGSGIESFIPDEFTVQNDWALITAVGGIRLLVAPENFEEAKKIYLEFTEQENSGPEGPA